MDCRKRLTCKTCGNSRQTILHYNPKDAKEPSNKEELGGMNNREEAETTRLLATALVFNIQLANEVALQIP